MIPDTDADYLSERTEIPRAGARTNELHLPPAERRGTWKAHPAINDRETDAHPALTQPGCLRRFASLLIALARLPAAHPGDHIISRQSNADRLRAITKGVRDAGH